MISFLMLGSLVFGLIAWYLAGRNISRRHNNNNNNNWAINSVASMSACTMAIFFQLSYSNLLVQTEDFISLMDTSGTSFLLSLILLISTLILNIIAIYIYCDQK